MTDRNEIDSIGKKEFLVRVCLVRNNRVSREERGREEREYSDLRVRVSFARVSLKFPRSTHTCYFRAYLIPRIVTLFRTCLSSSSFSTLSVQPSSTMPVKPYQMDAALLPFPDFLFIDAIRLWRFSFNDCSLIISHIYIVSFVIPVNKTIEKQVQPGIDDIER